MFEIPQNPFLMQQQQQQGGGLPAPLMQMLMLAMQGGAGEGGAFQPGQPPAQLPGVQPQGTQVPQVMPAPIPVPSMAGAPIQPQLPAMGQPMGLEQQMQEMQAKLAAASAVGPGWGGTVPSAGPVGDDGRPLMAGQARIAAPTVDRGF